MTPLQRAHQALKIQAVTLRDSSVKFNDDIDAFMLEDRATESQSLKGIRNLKVREFEPEDSTIKPHLEYDFFYTIGIRLVEQGYDKDEEPNVLLEIKATFNAVYKSEDELDQDVLSAFAEENVGFHVWPYWRELVQSSCARINIPPLTIPMYKCKSAD